MGRHRLFEWETRRFDAADAIPEAEAVSLVRAAHAPAARLKAGRGAFEFGRDGLRARNLVGIVAAGNASCEILPKVDRDAPGDATALRRQLIRMLGIAHDLPIADDAATSLDVRHETLLEILIARFCALLTDAVRRGVPRFYVAHADDLPALRGRMDVGRQFTTLAASPQRLACRYDEFSEDITLNQAMKAALGKLARLTRSLANARRIAELTTVYADVSAVPASALRWDAVAPDRANARWQAPLRLARLILGDRFQNSAAGEADGFALLFDMNALFERYLEKLIARIAPARGWRMTAQGGARSCLHPEGGGEPLFSTCPDMLLSRDGRMALVIDAKWKRLTDASRDRKRNVSQADVYQLMAYAQLYGCDEVALLYPHHGGLGSPVRARHRIAGADGSARLTIATVDVTSHEAARGDLAALLETVAI